MDELRIRIKVPSELTVVIPTWSDVSLEVAMEGIAKEGKQLIQRVIKERVLEEFQKKHEKLIGRAVKDLMAEKEDEIKKIIGLN